MKKLLTLSGALVALFALLPSGAIAGPHDHGSHRQNYSSQGHGHSHAPVRYVTRGNYQNYRYAQQQNYRYAQQQNYRYAQQQNYRYAQQQNYYSGGYGYSQYRPVYNSYRGYSRPGVTIQFGGGGHYCR